MLIGSLVLEIQKHLLVEIHNNDQRKERNNLWKNMPEFLKIALCLSDQCRFLRRVLLHINLLYISSTFTVIFLKTRIFHGKLEHRFLVVNE